MGKLNRNTMVIRFKKPVLDWLKKDGMFDFSLEEINFNTPTFLIPEFESIPEFEEKSDELKKYLFQEILATFNEDPNAWPNKEMTAKNFNKWFDYTLHETVLDVADEPLENQEL